MKQLLYTLSAILLLVSGCKKADFSNNDVTGEGLVDFALTGPASGTKTILNAATPTATIVFTWNPSKPGTVSPPKYKWVAALKTGDLTSPLLEFDADNAGATNKLTLTYKQLDDALKAKSIADGATTELMWSVTADNGSTKILSQSKFNITLTRFKDGATPFVLLGPAPTTSPMTLNPTSTGDQVKFNWTRSKPAAGGAAIKYKVVFTNNDNFTTPLFSIASDNSGADSLLTVTAKQLSDSIAAHGYADVALQADLKWTVVATSGSWQQQSDYINALSIIRQINFYLVGSINGWDINNVMKLVVDQKSDRYGKVFYTYINLAANDEFKFVKTPGDWGSAYGSTGGTGGSYTTALNGGDNFKVTTAGVYRLTIDLAANMAYVQQKAVGVVGNMQGWDPPNVILGAYVARDKFLIVAPSSGSDEFKLHDGTEWDNSTPGKSRWWGKGAADGLLDNDGNGANLVAASAPRTRVIWDGTDVQKVKYEMSPASEMRVVGDGINQAGVNDWDPASSPQMTYAGNGKWTITIALKGGKDVKFLAGDAWGAFDYEDNSGQSNTVGTPRGIKYDGGDNFKTPAAAGTYTIILDEHKQTVTFN